MCLIVFVRAASTATLQDFLDAVATVPAVTGTMTTVALSAIEDATEELCERIAK